MKKITMIVEDCDVQGTLDALEYAEDECLVSEAFTVKVEDYPVEEDSDE